jgi:hypothetical protein
MAFAIGPAPSDSGRYRGIPGLNCETKTAVAPYDGPDALGSGQPTICNNGGVLWKARETTYRRLSI